MKTTTQIIAVVLMTGTLGACMFHGGEQKHVSATTFGQELSDLKSALDSGAITDKEYQTMRERILNSCSTTDLDNRC